MLFMPSSKEIARSIGTPPVGRFRGRNEPVAPRAEQLDVTAEPGRGHVVDAPVRLPDSVVGEMRPPGRAAAQGGGGERMTLPEHPRLGHAIATETRRIRCPLEDARHRHFLPQETRLTQTQIYARRQQFPRSGSGPHHPTRKSRSERRV